ncbi:MAG: hypothetical protein Q4A05_11040, partial [Ruminococcus sp.]|nr:hypothetical protein [Ruminococcus sp.]
TAQTVTTTTAARTYVTAAATTAPPQTMPPASTQTTASAEVPATTAATTTAAPEVEIWKRVYYGDNKMYRMCSVDNEELTVAESSVGEYYDDAVLAVDIIDIASNRTKRVETPCRIYAYKDLSPEYICIIKETEDSEPKLYSAGASCEALEKSPLVLEYEEAQ